MIRNEGHYIQLANKLSSGHIPLQKNYLALICMVTFLLYIGLGFLPASGILIMDKYDISLPIFALFAAFEYIGIAIGSFVSSNIFMTKKCETRTILLICFGCLSFSQMLYSLMPMWELMIFFRFLSGLFQGPLLAYSAMRIRLFAGQNIQKWIFVFYFSNSFGFIIGFTLSYTAQYFYEQMINWQYFGHGLVILLVFLGTFSLKNVNLNINYLLQVVRKEIVFDENINQPTFMKTQQIQLKSNKPRQKLTEEQIKFRLKSMDRYGGFQYLVKQLFSQKVFIFSLFMSICRNSVQVAILFWLQIAFVNILCFTVKNAFLCSVIIIATSQFLGYIIGFVIQDKQNIRSKKNVYIIISLFAFSLVNLIILSLCMIFDFYDQKQVYVQFGITLACMCSIQPFIQSFISSHLPSHLKVFSIGPSLCSDYLFGYQLGPLIGMVLIYGDVGLDIYLVILSFISMISFGFSFLFKGFVRDDHLDEKSENPSIQSSFRKNSNTQQQGLVLDMRNCSKLLTIGQLKLQQQQKQKQYQEQLNQQKQSIQQQSTSYDYEDSQQDSCQNQENQEQIQQKYIQYMQNKTESIVSSEDYEGYDSSNASSLQNGSHFRSFTEPGNDQL